MRIALVGGGSSAHLAAVLLGGRGHEVRILTSRPALWSGELVLETSEGELSGRIAGAGNDPMQIVGTAEVAIFCMPVHRYQVALDWIMPALAVNKNCIVGTVYGQGGFDWMVKAAARKCGCAVPRHFAIGLLPWIARTVKYGNRSISYGPKLRNGIATSCAATFDLLQERLLDDLSFADWKCGRFERIPNFTTVTLTVDNQIIHPARCFALAQQKRNGWDNEESVPYFYRDWDDFSAEILKGIDEDYSVVRKMLFKRFPSLDNPYSLSYLELEHWSYGSHNPDIKASFVNSQTLCAIKPPVVHDRGRWRLDMENRFFKDDFTYGLDVCKWLANQLGCPVPHVDKLLAWYATDIMPHQQFALSYDILLTSTIEDVLVV